MAFIALGALDAGHDVIGFLGLQDESVMFLWLV